MSAHDSSYSIWREDDEKLHSASAAALNEGGLTGDSEADATETETEIEAGDHTDQHPYSYVAHSETISTSSLASSYYQHIHAAALPSAAASASPAQPLLFPVSDTATAVPVPVPVPASAPHSQLPSTTRVELSDLHSSPSPPFNDPLRMTWLPRSSPPSSVTDPITTASAAAAGAATVSTYSLPYNRTAAYLLAKHRGALTPPHLRTSREVDGDSSSSSLLPVEQHFAATNRVMRELDQEEARAQEAAETAAQTHTDFHATARTVPQTSFSGSFASIAAEAATLHLHSSPQPASLLFPPGASSIMQVPTAGTAIRKSSSESDDRPLSASTLASSSSTSVFSSSSAANTVRAIAAAATVSQQPWSRALSSPIHTTGLNAEYFRSKLADRVSIGSPESVIENSFQYQYAQQLADPHLNMAQSSAKLAAAIAAPQTIHTSNNYANVQAQVGVNPSASPAHSRTIASSPPSGPPPATAAAASPTTSISNLRAQLRQLASSPTFTRRQDEPAKLMPQLSPTATDADSIHAPFDASMSRLAVNGSNGLTLSQLLSSPPPTASPLSASVSTDGRNAPEAASSAVRHHLSGLGHNLQEFREDLLIQRHQFDQDRAEALALLGEGNDTLDESMTLESRNRDVSIESMKKYTETLIEAWNLAHADVWNAEIQRLEDAAAEFEQKIGTFDHSQQVWEHERTSQFRQVDDQVARTLSSLSSSFESMRADHEIESNHRALLKLRSLEAKMQHLVEKHGREQLQLQAELDAAMQQLVQQRVQLVSDVESSIVIDITDVRRDMVSTTNERIEGDQQLRKAFTFSTYKLQKGLMMLRK